MTSEIPPFKPGENDVLRICVLVAEMDDPLPGSEQRECADCGRAVWFNTKQVFRPGEEFGANPDLILCGACGIVRIAEEGAFVMNSGPEPFVIKSLAEQAKEFLDGH